LFFVKKLLPTFCIGAIRQSKQIFLQSTMRSVLRSQVVFFLLVVCFVTFFFSSDSKLGAIVVSEETLSGGAAVNEKRVEANLGLLIVLIVDCWDRHSNKEGQSVATKISSTDARKRLSVARGNKM
jgi:hypothetical protein